jgi:2-oxo-4-hydroxy-4-carboxy-5-ureidoimidazoline decarboxylase
MMARRLTLSEVNQLGRDEFSQIFGGVFERSPWIAGKTFVQRPFANLEELHEAFCKTVNDSSPEQKLALIRAHPDLVGRAALAGTLTRESSSEQASAGLGALTPQEIETFQRFNATYRGKFGFPFVICARLNKKEAILAGFERRLPNSLQGEVETALSEIFKIAYLRLQDLIQQHI